MATSFVVTGSARGVGRAIAQRLSRRGFVVAVDRDRDALGWTSDQENVLGLTGDVTNEHDLAHAVERAAAAGPLEGWVNNAAVFRDAAVHDTSVHDLMVLISANLAMAVAGSSTPSTSSSLPKPPARSSTSRPTGPSGPSPAPCPTPGQGSHRGPHPGPGRRLRPTGHQGQRRRSWLSRHRSLRPCPRPGTRAAAPPGPCRTAGGGRRRGRPPAVGRRQLRHRRSDPRRRWSVRTGSGPRSTRRHRPSGP